ncbi:hypothetical protein [Terricaulis silvestris]|nr:hypothetical protein [Terricaulis silvestris]
MRAPFIAVFTLSYRFENKWDFSRALILRWWNVIRRNRPLQRGLSAAMA